MMKEAMVQAEMKGVKDRLHAKRKNGTRKSVGTLPSMKKGKLRAMAEAIVTARLAGGVALAAVSPNTSSSASPSSSSSSSTSSSSASASSSSSASSPSASASSNIAYLASTFLSGLIADDARYRGHKEIKFVSILFEAAPELWINYSTAAGVSEEFVRASKCQRTTVYHHMCRSEVAAAPDFISRIGIPTTEEAM